MPVGIGCAHRQHDDGVCWWRFMSPSCWPVRPDQRIGRAARGCAGRKRGGIEMRRTRLAVCLIGIATVATLLVSASSTQARATRPYLALGDSVVFGFIDKAGFEYVNPDNFVGYPRYVDRKLGLDTVNASCPGEATGGVLSPTG